jgi:hypothetical protein
VKTIYKYPMPIVDELTKELPAGSQLLCVQMQRGEPQLWAVVDTDQPPVARDFRWVGTGHPFDLGTHCAYIGTVQISEGLRVFHLFEVPAAAAGKGEGDGVERE